MSAGVGRKTACVTGGSGCIASALVKTLLDKGYAVKTTVRDPDDMEKKSHLKDLLALGPLEIVRAQLDEEGSFDEAVSGCETTAFLVAAPMNLVSEDPEKDLIEAAVQGTLNVMRPCVKAGTVKRVILTSSDAGVSRRLLAAGRRARAGRGVLVRRRLPQSPQATHLGTLQTNIVLSPVQFSSVQPNTLIHRWKISSAYDRGLVFLRRRLTRCRRCCWRRRPASSRRRTASASSPCCRCSPWAPRRSSRPGPASPSPCMPGDEVQLDILKGLQSVTGSVSISHVDDLCRAEVFLADNESSSGRYICCSHNTTVVQLARRLLADKYPRYDVKADRFDGCAEEPWVRLSSAKLAGRGFEFK